MRALDGAPEGPAILANFAFDAFIRVRDADLDPVPEFARKLRFQY